MTPKADPPADPPATCGNCPFYERPPGAMTANAAIAGIDPRGVCKALPTVAKKSVEDWCGLHPRRRVA